MPQYFDQPLIENTMNLQSKDSILDCLQYVIDFFAIVAKNTPSYLPKCLIGLCMKARLVVLVRTYYLPYCKGVENSVFVPHSSCTLLLYILVASRG